MNKKIFLLPLLALVLAGCTTPCDSTDPNGDCYVTPTCDPTDPNGECYTPPPCDPNDPDGECYVPPVVEPETVDVSPSGAQTVFVGDTLQLTATVLPENADYDAISWNSTSIARATVSATGLVTGIEVGTTNIRAQVKNSLGESIRSEIVTVTVARQPGVNNIDNLFNTTSYAKGDAVTNIKGYVVVKNSNGMVVGDSSGYVLIYNGNNAGTYPLTGNVGDTIIFGGSIGYYAGTTQVINPTNTVVTNATDKIDPATLPAATPITGTAIDTYHAPIVAGTDLASTGILKPVRTLFSDLRVILEGDFKNQKHPDSGVILGLQPTMSALTEGAILEDFDGFMLGLGSLSGTRRINLYANASDIIESAASFDPVSEVKFNTTPNFEVEVGKFVQLDWSVLPSSARQTVTFAQTIGNTNFSVSQTGLVSGLVANEGTDTCEVQVKSVADETKLATISFTVVPSTTPPSESYNKITFDHFTSTDTVALTPAGLLTILKSGSASGAGDTITSVTSSAYTYQGNGTGGDPFVGVNTVLKLGNASNPGTFTFTTSENIVKVVIVAAGWSTSAGSLSVNGSAAQSFAMPSTANTTAAQVTREFDIAASNSIAILSVARVRIISIELFIAD